MFKKILRNTLILMFSVSGLSFGIVVTEWKGKIVDEIPKAIAGAKVILAAFPAGEVEPNYKYTKVCRTKTDGTFSVKDLAMKDSGGNDITYKLIFTSEKKVPTMKDQINNPYILSYIFTNLSLLMDTTIPPLKLSTPWDFKAGTLCVKVSTTSAPLETMLTAELRHKISQEQVAFDIDVSTYEETAGWFNFYIHNVPPAPANTYELFLNKAGSGEGADVVITQEIFDSVTSTQTVELGYYSGTRSEAQTTINFANVAFEGFVTDTSSKPIANCLVEVREATNTFNNNWTKTLTDSSGKFVVFNDSILINKYYQIQVSKLGYKSKFDRPFGATAGYYYQGQRIVLPKYELPIATGIIRGCVLISSKPLPSAEVNLETETDSRWMGPYIVSSIMEGNGSFRTFSNADGSFEFNGVAPGNYNLRINDPVFYNSGDTKYWHGENSDPWNYNYIYNYGDDQKSSTTVASRAMDDRRIVVTTDTNHPTRVYDADGIQVGTDNFTIPINIEITISTNAVITGKLLFPDSSVPDMSKFKIVAHPIDSQTGEWLEWEGNAISYSASTQTITASAGQAVYSIYATTGVYQVEIKSNLWAPLEMFNAQAVLEAVNSVWTLPDISMVKCGKLQGKIKLPDGRYFQASSGSNGSKNARIEVKGIDFPYFAETELQDWSSDPTTFSFDALPPGKYSLWIEIKKYPQSGGNGELLYPVMSISDVRISLEQTTFVEASMKEGVLCEPLAPLPPENPEVIYSRSASGMSMYILIGFPADITVKGSLINSLMTNQGKADDLYIPQLEYDYNTKSWKSSQIFPGKFNFYMIYVRIFSPEGMPFQGGPMGNSDEYVTIIGKAENVEIKSDTLAPGSTFQIKMGAGTMGPGILTGRVKGTKFLMAEDSEKIKGNVMALSKYTPTIMLYDMDGNFKGYSSVVPSNDAAAVSQWTIAFMTGDIIKINSMVNSDAPALTSPVHYYIDNLPLGKYVMVCESKYYPPVTKLITVSTGTSTVEIDLDKDAPAGMTLSGTVTDENDVPLSGANVVLAHRMVTKKVLTDANGKFSVLGLPQGTYRIDVTKTGYATGGEKISLGSGSGSVTIKIKTANAKISGTVFVREGGWSKQSVYTGAKIAAYNETENTTNPGKYLPSLATKTENDGTYVIPDLLLNSTYYVYAFVPERPVYYKRVFVNSAAMTDINFDIQPSTPALRITMKRTENPYMFKFIIDSPRPLIAPPECYYSPGRTYNNLKKVRALPTLGAKNSYVLIVEIPENGTDEYYTLQIKGQYGMKEYMTEEINFSQKFLAKARKQVAEELAEGGSILIDDERADNTEVTLDPGTVTSTEMSDMPVGGFLSALPNFKMSKTGRDISALMDSALSNIAASEVYEIGLDNAQVNKSFDVTVNYDRKKVSESELDELQVYRYNDSTQKWEQMPGVTAVDPLTGTVSVEADTLQSSNGQNPAPKAVIKNGVFAINKAVSTSQTGAFAVFKQDPNTAKQFTGNDFAIYNFPNPFNLKAKNVTLADVNSAAAQTVTGTMIKYSLPSDKTGRIKFFIYNLAGELVRELDEGSKTGGYYYYTEWDGKNDNSEECASGVYFLIAKSDGRKLNSKPLKMAILK